MISFSNERERDIEKIRRALREIIAKKKGIYIMQVDDKIDELTISEFIEILESKLNELSSTSI